MPLHLSLPLTVRWPLHLAGLACAAGQACAAGLALPAQAAGTELARYTFTADNTNANAGALASVDTDPDSTASRFNRTGTQLGPPTNATLGAAALSNAAAKSEAVVRSAPHFFWFSVTPGDGLALALDTLSLRAAGNPNTTGGSFAVDYSTDGSQYLPLIGATAFAPRVGGVTFTDHSADLSGAAFQNLTAPITFRLYAWEDTANGVKGYFDDVVLTGAVAPVPEPATAWMALAGLALMGARLRRRTRA